MANWTDSVRRVYAKVIGTYPDGAVNIDSTNGLKSFEFEEDVATDGYFAVGCVTGYTGTVTIYNKDSGSANFLKYVPQMTDIQICMALYEDSAVGSIIEVCDGAVCEIDKSRDTTKISFQSKALTLLDAKFENENGATITTAKGLINAVASDCGFSVSGLDLLTDVSISKVFEGTCREQLAWASGLLGANVTCPAVCADGITVYVKKHLQASTYTLANTLIYEGEEIISDQQTFAGILSSDGQKYGSAPFYYIDNPYVKNGLIALADIYPGAISYYPCTIEWRGIPVSLAPITPTNCMTVVNKRTNVTMIKHSYSDGGFKAYFECADPCNEDTAVASTTQEGYKTYSGTVTSQAMVLNNSPSMSGFDNLYSSGSASAGTGYTYTGISFTVPANSVFVVTAQAWYSSVAPSKICISKSSATTGSGNMQAEGSVDSANTRAQVTWCNSTNADTTFYVWVRNASSGTVGVSVNGIYFTIGG